MTLSYQQQDTNAWINKAMTLWLRGLVVKSYITHKDMLGSNNDMQVAFNMQLLRITQTTPKTTHSTLLGT